MSSDPAPEKPLICPACFAREIDPVFLHYDPEGGGEFYCQQCGYAAKTRTEVEEFLNEIIWRRYRIRRRPAQKAL